MQKIIFFGCIVMGMFVKEFYFYVNRTSKKDENSLFFTILKKTKKFNKFLRIMMIGSFYCIVWAFMLEFFKPTTNIQAGMLGILSVSDFLNNLCTKGEKLNGE